MKKKRLYANEGRQIHTELASHPPSSAN